MVGFFPTLLLELHTIVINLNCNREVSASAVKVLAYLVSAHPSVLLLGLVPGQLLFLSVSAVMRILITSIVSDIDHLAVPAATKLAKDELTGNVNRKLAVGTVEN